MNRERTSKTQPITPKTENGKTKMLKYFPLAFLLVLGVLWKIESDVYHKFSGRESPIETFQLIFYLTASLIFFKVMHNNRKHKSKIYPIYFLLLALVLFFIAMEEISWCQNLFDFDTPDMIEENNFQKELTLHNLNIFQKTFLLHLSFILAGSFFAVIPRLDKKLPKLKPYINDLLPGKNLFWYFASVALFYSFIELAEPIIRTVEDSYGTAVGGQEAPEGILALGFLIYAIRSWQNSRRNKT